MADYRVQKSAKFGTKCAALVFIKFLKDMCGDSDYGVPQYVNCWRADRQPMDGDAYDVEYIARGTGAGQVRLAGIAEGIDYARRELETGVTVSPTPVPINDAPVKDKAKTRAEYEEELRQLEGLMRDRTPDEQRRVTLIAGALRECFCRECGCQYDNAKSRADYKGYCSAKCLHAKAKALGYRKSTDKSSKFWRKLRISASTNWLAL